jgi:N-acetylneuraminic acid mutarotase
MAAIMHRFGVLCLPLVFSLASIISGCGGGNAARSISPAPTPTPTPNPGPAPTPTVSNLWTWIGGTSLGSPGAYGTLGVAASTNLPPARSRALQWTDKKGNFWLFGGVTSSDEYFNDLWAYNPSTNAWTWVSGSSTWGASGTYGTQGQPSTENTPGARYGCVGWTDANGNLWLFGGGYYAIGTGESQTGTGYFNDLWEFVPSDKTWTWVSGGDKWGGDLANYGTLGVEASSNLPPARSYAASWTDAQGNLWLFGGLTAYGGLNDIWKFNPSTKHWTWMGGSNAVNASSSPGSIGIASSSTVPGALSGGIFWRDGQGNFWLFGGSKWGVNGGLGFSWDIWEFSPNSNIWTWMGPTSGTWGAQGEGSSANGPAGRSDSLSWTDRKGNLWMFGGTGADAYGTSGTLNDLWKLDPETMTWTWVSGANKADPNGTYGTQGAASASNAPGGRSSAVGWKDSDDNLWIFGGYGQSSSVGPIYLSDLWRYQP